MKKVLVCLALLCAVAMPLPYSALAAMDTAYVVMDEKNQDVAAPLINYLKDSGTTVEIVKPAGISIVNNKAYYIVIGSPKDNDAIAELAKANLSPKQWENATKMGKSGPVLATVGNGKVLFLFSDYSLKSLISGSKDVWTETFSDWYDIPLSMTHIIGY